MIQSAMMFALGVFVSGLVWLAFSVAFVRRARRITERRLLAGIATRRAEFERERDELRARHAVQMHRLEREVSRVLDMATAYRLEADLKERDLMSARAELDAEREDFSDIETRLHRANATTSRIWSGAPPRPDRRSEPRSISSSWRPSGGPRRRSARRGEHPCRPAARGARRSARGEQCAARPPRRGAGRAAALRARRAKAAARRHQADATMAEDEAVVRRATPRHDPRSRAGAWCRCRAAARAPCRFPRGLALQQPGSATVRAEASARPAAHRRRAGRGRRRSLKRRVPLRRRAMPAAPVPGVANIGELVALRMATPPARRTAKPRPRSRSTRRPNRSSSKRWRKSAR